MTDDTTTPAVPTEVEPSRPAGRLARASRPIPLLSLALVASLLFSAFLLLRGSEDDEGERGELLAIAETYAVNLTTYDSARLDADFARVMDVATGQFRSEYEVAQDSLRELIVKYQGKATGKVLARAVLSLDGGRGEVVLFVDQTVTNTNSDQPKIDRLRMRMGLEKQSGRWLINKLDLV
ncbi:hypothetical protein [Sporichthya polymorpha]|uniref:hypothetical protein n=1 Tax=Sporichthya polymorpha TaxID=35751 RepID=UPI000380D925|nr:hypothetical protein [Sporichthya polymorpha]